MHTYVICVLLYASSPRVCWELRPEQSCQQVMSDWLQRAAEWGRRNKIPTGQAMHCGCRDDMGEIRRDEYMSVYNN